MRKLFLPSLLSALGLALSLAAAERSSVPDVSHLALPGGTTASVDRRLNQAYGEVEIVVRLGDPPLVVAQGEGAKKRGGRLTRAQQREHVGQLSRKQDELVQSIRALGGREIARVTKALNAVILRVDASRIPTIAGNTALATAVSQYGTVTIRNPQTHA